MLIVKECVIWGSPVGLIRVYGALRIIKALRFDHREVCDSYKQDLKGIVDVIHRHRPDASVPRSFRIKER